MTLNALRSFALASALAVFAMPALADDIVFTLTNATDVDLIEFYASPTTSDDWEDDILGEDILPAGAQAEITIGGDRGCDYDLKAVFADGDEVTEQLNICEIDDFTIGSE